jgi:hypothetical protein
MSSGHDVSEYEFGASGLPRAYVSPTTVQKLIEKNHDFCKKRKQCGAMTTRRIG